MGSGRGWLAGDWPSTGGVLNITAAAWNAGFLWRSRNKKRTQNVSEYMLLVLALAVCLVPSLGGSAAGKVTVGLASSSTFTSHAPVIS